MLLGFIAMVSLWTPLQDPTIAQRWFHGDIFYRLLPVPFLVAIRAFFMHRAVRARHHNTPFVLALLLVLLGYPGLLVSLWPYAIPSSMTLWKAARRIRARPSRWSAQR